MIEMIEMIERVARALANKRYIHVGGADAECLVPGKKNWTFCADDARTAIEAMRTPTQEMEAPIWAAGSLAPEDVWPAMIEIALK